MSALTCHSDDTMNIDLAEMNSIFNSEIDRIVVQGGPNVEDHKILNQFLDEIKNSRNPDLISDIVAKFQQEDFIQSHESIIGHIKNRPYGYAGDFKIIDRIYTGSKSVEFEKWDSYSLAQEGATAVINRKSYFIKTILKRLEIGPVNLLNVASGPARDLCELYDQLVDSDVLVSNCVDMDINAIEYATNLCQSHLSNINFTRSNIFRYRDTKKYDVIWSAGLFDYLSDAEFVLILKNLLGSLNESGEVIIGNFSDNNPSRGFMELLGDWFLNHRSEEDLINLALRSGVLRSQITVDKEPLGINLFLRISAKEGN